jgi:hypothetical protein
LRKVLGYAGADIADQVSARIPVSREQISTDGLIEDQTIRDEIAAAVGRLLAHTARTAAND